MLLCACFTSNISSQSSEVDKTPVHFLFLNFLQTTKAVNHCALVFLQTLQELRDLNNWVKDCLSDLDAQPPLADTLEGARKQKEWHKVRGTVMGG